MIRESVITLYCSFRSDDSTEWRRTNLFVHKERYIGKTQTGTSEIKTDSITFFAPRAVEAETGKTYVEPAVYDRLADREGYFTFRKGDIIIPYELDEDILSERTFISAHPEAVRITGCNENLFGSPKLQHWEVICSE